MKIQQYIFNQLEILPHIALSDQFIEPGTSGYDDYRESIHPKRRKQRADPTFKPAFYYQVFQDRYGFIQNLSIIDLLFNEGPNAENILKQSVDPNSFIRHKGEK